MGKSPERLMHLDGHIAETGYWVGCAAICDYFSFVGKTAIYFRQEKSNCLYKKLSFVNMGRDIANFYEQLKS